MSPRASPRTRVRPGRRHRGRDRGLVSSGEGRRRSIPSRRQIDEESAADIVGEEANRQRPARKRRRRWKAEISSFRGPITTNHTPRLFSTRKRRRFSTRRGGEPEPRRRQLARHIFCTMTTSVITTTMTMRKYMHVIMRLFFWCVSALTSCFRPSSTVTATCSQL